MQASKKKKTQKLQQQQKIEVNDKWNQLKS